MKRRVVLVALVGGACFAVSLLPVHGGPGLLLPDLVPLQAPLERAYVSREGGRTLLRFETDLANQGQGYLEVRGSRSGRRRPMIATQRIRQSDGGVTKRQVGEMMYHDTHNHWHLLQVAAYRLRAADGRLVGTNSKVSFCLMDSFRAFPNLPGSPRRRQYTTCPGGQRILSLTTGVSVGWADVYGARLPDQWVDVTGLPPGTYTLEVEANPNGILSEITRGNNIATAQIQL